jgi:single-strand DNA-binding protein
VNSVSLVGQLTSDPELRRTSTGVEECRMRLAVQRRERGGRPEPGVVYIEVAAFHLEARECVKRLRTGDRIGLAGRLEPEDGRHVVIEQLDFLSAH